MTARTSSTPLLDPWRLTVAEADNQARSIELLGYTPREATFLATVACAGGYFLRRHFAGALGLARGASDAALIERLVSNRHATRYGFCRAEQVFHLCAAVFYAGRYPGRGRATRPRPALTITRRLMALDAILSRPDCRFVCGRAEWVALCERAGLVPADLPSRDYRPGGSPLPVSRMLPDLPLLGFDTATRSPLTLVTGYVAEPSETAAGFETFASRHARLFAGEASWRVWYICQSALQADRARRTFDRAMSADIRAGAARAEALGREYCELRHLYDAQAWQQLDTTKIRRLFELKQRLGAHADRVYTAWVTRASSDTRGPSLGPLARPRARFEPVVLAHRYTALEPVRGLR